jgi:hypothetical protein
MQPKKEEKRKGKKRKGITAAQPKAYWFHGSERYP